MGDKSISSMVVFSLECQKLSLMKTAHDCKPQAGHYRRGVLSATGRELTRCGPAKCEHLQVQPSLCCEVQVKLQAAYCFKPSGYLDLCDLENKWFSPTPSYLITIWIQLSPVT